MALGAILFSFQIYGDFSGYSDIALGSARLFGIDLLKNFAFPYFSRDMAEFWRRWHISLSSWFKDYLYIPLGGSKGSNWLKIRNTLVIFLVSGFWHGANWTFIVWGLLNAIFILPSMFFNTHRNNLQIVAAGKLFPSFKSLIAMIITFTLSTFAWIFFRAENLSKALHYCQKIFSFSSMSMPEINPVALYKCLVILLVVEWLGREKEYALAHLEEKMPALFRWSAYYILVYLIFYHVGAEQQFIYFQF